MRLAGYKTRMRAVKEFSWKTWSEETIWKN